MLPLGVVALFRHQQTELREVQHLRILVTIFEFLKGGQGKFTVE